jgi:sialidase-1
MMKFLVGLALSLVASFVNQASPLQASEPILEKSVLFSERTDGFTLYRIPGIVVTAKGTVLVYCEARKFSDADRGEIEIHMRRSTDGGRTFTPAQQVAHLGDRLPRNPHMPLKKTQKDMGGPNEQTVNNPVAIANRDGSVHLLYCVEYMRCFHIRSDDDGVSWSRPAEITSAFDAFRDHVDWQVIATGPGHGIQLNSGRLVVPFWMATYEQSPELRKAVGIVFSDDNGVTWQPGELAVPLGGEPNVVELSDGRVMVTARNTDSRNRRMVSVSPNGTSDWSVPVFVEELLEPGCMAGIVSHSATEPDDEPSRTIDRSLLLFSGLHTTDREHSARRDVTIRVSYDDGLTWPIARCLQPGPSAYSDLAVLPDGTVLCFFESGTEKPAIKRKRDWAYANLTLARFHLAWLHDQAPFTQPQ